MGFTGTINFNFITRAEYPLEIKHGQLGHPLSGWIFQPTSCHRAIYRVLKMNRNIQELKLPELVICHRFFFDP
jgi:hypothetical protein